MKEVTSVSLDELKALSEKMYGGLVKADVDIVKRIVLIDMEMHADGEAYLLEHGSKQQDIWGINLYPASYGTAEFLEFDSMINIRPTQKNPSRDVLDEAIRDAITKIIGGVVHD